tara:strand:+ start:30266 stop:32665 length:2400 start_codon:yes stop_codon:yes gene_type:complete
MASTASDLIKFEKMTTGEKSGTWGPLANTAMSRIEEAIAGMTTITLAGSNYTLDDTQYVEHTSTTAQSHLAIIKAIGTPGTSRTIVVPLRTKKYLIWNATTDGSALAVGGSSGATVTIANGNLAEVFCDGTNVEFCGPQITTAGVMVSATATSTGVVELATNAEAVAGTDTARAITAANLLAANAIATTKGADIASGSPTVTADGNYFDVTGTTTVAAWAVAADRHFYTQFDGALQLTHHTTNLDLPGLANITTAAGDVAEWQSTGSNTCQCVAYTKVDGTAIVSAVLSDTTPQLGGFLDTNDKFVSFSQGGAIASVAGDTNIWSAFDGNTVHITGTNAITDFGTPKQAGDSMWVIFDAAASVVDSATITVAGNTNFQAAANDLALVYALSTSTFLFIPFKNDGTAVTNSAINSVVEDTTPQLGGFLDTNSRFISYSQGANIASVAGDTDIWNAFDGNTVHITGTNTITDFGTPKQAGDSMWLIFDAAAVVADSATITCAGNTNFQAAANDLALVYALSTSTFLFIPFKNDGTSAIAPTVVADTTPQLGGFLDANGNYMQTEKGGDLTSASPLVIDTDGDYFDVTGTTNFSVMTVAADRQFTLQFDGALTMTHHATNLDLPGAANITTAAGDVGVFQSTGANTVQCIAYTKADGTAVSAGAGGGPSKGTAPSTFYRTNAKVQNEDLTISNHSATFSATNATNLLDKGTDDGFADDMNVRLTGSDLPNGWVIDTDYFVRDVASATLKLALTIGGSAVTISDDGSGTNTIFEVINAGVIGPITIKTGNSLTIPSGSRVLIQ